ncbi:hypothetical protein [Parasphaerochaeta coccoides]|uniref:Phage MuF C-terminal domain-containing protein n=1 Tax=Parasphaerochaeta coccoides (strain ATCC BAA-1237 / DSM 17374 / SPN1) TaxID=760011 RepID=F4GL43_PARC1|nr:hypothetical protein [Parasphaerochaeta coccoides]AEC02383.1 hypothetical protein Spico_1169 [Parasphaerochaeta coccoides DSM 17374]
MNTQFTFQPIYRNYQQTDSYKYDSQGRLITALTAQQIQANDTLQSNLRAIWQMGDDPKSAEARTKIAYVASAATGMSFSDAYKNSSSILKHYTGLRTDDVSGWSAFADGIKQGYYQQMAGLNQWMADHSEGEIVQRYRRNAQGFRQSAATMKDFQDRSAVAEWFIGASPFIQQLAIQLAFTGITAGIGGLVSAASGVAGGLRLGAQIGGWAASASMGMIESGSTSAEIDALAEEYGIEVDQDTKRKISDAVGLVNMFLEHWQLSSMPGVRTLYRAGSQTAIDKAAKQSLKSILKGAVKTYLIEGIGENTAQEVSQELVTMLGVEAYKMAANEAGAHYDYAKGEEYYNRLWDTAKSSAAAFALTGGFGTVSEVLVDSVTNGKVGSDANKMYQEGTAVNSRWVDTSGVKGRKLSKDELKKLETKKLPPIDVVEFRGGLKAVHPEDAQRLADLQASGIVGANVTKVTPETVENEETRHLAHTMAVAFDARVNGNTVVFQDPQEMSASVSGLVNREPSVFGVDVKESSVELTFRQDDGSFTKISFTTEGYADAASPMTDAPFAAGNTDSGNAFVRTFRGTSDAELESGYLEHAVAPTIKAAAPHLSDADVTATTGFISVMSRITGMTVDQFMQTRFSDTPFVIRTDRRRAGELASVSREQDGRFTIHLTEDADVGSVTHELSHVTRMSLSAQQLAPFESIYGVKDGKWYERPIQSSDGKWVWNGTTYDDRQRAFDAAAQFEERFADDLVTYVQTGKAPKPELTSFFETMKKALKELIRYLKNYLSPETVAAFDRLFSEDGTAENRAGRAVELFEREFSLTPQEAQRQYTEVETRYRGTDLWMKAPNGKPTNLTERQWVTVRTTAFKNWFGDWETVIPDAASKIETIIDSLEKSSSVVSGEKLPFSVSDNASDTRKKIRTMTAGIRASYINKDSQESIEFNRSSLDDLLRHDYLNEEHLASLFAIPKFIENGKILGSFTDGNARKFTYLLSLFEYNGNRYVVRSSLREESGKYYYDHKLSSLEKVKNLLAALPYSRQENNGTPWLTSPARAPKDSYAIEDKRLFSLLQGFSVVVDENGEPRVVYHGTDKDFSEFQSKDGVSWFSESMDYAEAMAEERNGDRIVEAYLNIRNPYITSLPSGQFTDPTAEAPLIQKAQDAGHDGMIISNQTDDELVKDTYYGAFAPEQIKSATDNVGTFNATNPSILFQTEDFPNVLFQTASVRMDVPFNENEGGESRVYALAEESRTEFSDTVRAMAAAFHLPDDAVMFRRDLKGVERARVKVTQDYGGDWGRLLDINGAMLVFEESSDAQAAYERILKEHADIVAREKKKDTPFGYKDFTVNIRMSNGFIGEVQLLGKAIFHAKETGGHEIYAEARKFEKYRYGKEKYVALFGKDVYERIDRLYESLKAWSVEVYSSKGFEYDKPGLSAKASATLRESMELSNALRTNIPPSLSVGGLSTTDLPSGEGTSTASKANPRSSVLMGISQISRYMTAIESSSSLSIPNSQESDKISADGVKEESSRIGGRLQWLSPDIRELNDSLIMKEDIVNIASRERADRERLQKKDLAWFGREVNSITDVVRRGHAQVLHHTPIIFQALGLPNLPLVMYRSKMKTILYDKEKGHINSIDKAILKQLPDALQDPFLVFASTSKGYVAVLDMLDIQGNPVVVALHPNERTGHITANLIASAYGKSINALQNWIDEGLLRYQKKEAGIFSRLPVSRLQLPLEGSIPALGKMILTKEDVVNNDSPDPDQELFELSPKAKEEQRRRNRDEVIRALEAGYRVSDDILQEFSDDPDVQWEIQFRKVLNLEMLRLYREARDQVEQERTAALKSLEEQESARLAWGTLEDYQIVMARFNLMLKAEGEVDMDMPSGSDVRFIKRLDKEYSLSTPAVANASFLANYANTVRDVVSFAKQLRENGITRGQMPPQMWALTIRGENTPKQVEAVMKLMKGDPRYFRKLLAAAGDEYQRQQLYYEQTLGLDEWVDNTTFSRNVRDLSLTWQDVQGEEDFNRAVNRRLKAQTAQVLSLKRQVRGLRNVRRRQAVRQEMIQHARNISKKWNPNLAAWYEPIGNLLNQLIDPNFRSEKRIANWQQEKGYVVEIPQEMKGIIVTEEDGTITLHKPLNRWSLKELQIMDELVSQIRLRARQDETVRRNRAWSASETFVSAVGNQELLHYGKGTDGQKPLVTDPQSKEAIKQENKGTLIEGIKAWLFTPRNMAWELDWRNEYGVWHDLCDRLDVAATAESASVHRRLDAWKAKMKELGITQDDLYAHTILTPSGRHFTRSQGMGIYLNSSNKTNRQKLQGFVLDEKGKPIDIEGPGLTHAYSDEDIRYMVGQLEPHYIELAQWMKKEMGVTREAMAKVLAEEYNIPMHKVADYWPLVPMEAEESQQDVLMSGYGPSQKYVGRSQTRHRSSWSAYEINLDAVAVFENQIKKQEHFINFAGIVKGMQYTLNKKKGGLYDLIARNHSKKYADWIQRYFNDIASPHLVNTDLKGLFDKLRSNYAIAKLGFNVATVLRQTGAVWMFMGEFSPIDLMSASKEMMSDFDGTTKRVYSLAPQMQDRVAERAFLDIKGIETRTKYGRTMKKVGELAMSPIQWADSCIANTLWLGAYKSAMKKGMDSAKASQEATAFIKRTQQTSTVLDADQLHRTNNQLIKWLTMFTTQGVKEFNMIWADIPRYFRQKDYKKAIGMIAGLGLNWVTMLLIGGALFPGDDEEEYWKNLMLSFAGEVSQSVTVVDTPDGQDVYILTSREEETVIERFDESVCDDWHDRDDAIQFTPRVVLNPFETQTSIGQVKKVSRVFARMYQTGRICIGSTQRMEPPTREIGSDDADVYTSTGFDKQLQLVIEGVEDDPMTILAIVMEVDVA